MASYELPPQKFSGDEVTNTQQKENVEKGSTYTLLGTSISPAKVCLSRCVSFPQSGYVSVPWRINLPPLWTVLLNFKESDAPGWIDTRWNQPGPQRLVVDSWYTGEENQGFSFGEFSFWKLQKMQPIWTMCQVGWLDHHRDWLRTGRWFPPHIRSMKSDKKPSFCIACHGAMS